MSRTHLPHRLLMVVLSLAFVAMPLALKAQTPGANTTGSPADAQKQIAEIEKQLAELNKKLAELKAEKPAPPRAIEIADMSGWKAIRSASVSNNGEWFAYRVGPAEGDGEIIVKQAKGTKEHKFPAGGSGGPSGVPAGLAALLGGGGFSFSHDSKWFAFTVNPPTRGTPAAAGGLAGAAAAAATPAAKTVILNLSTGDKVEYEGIRRFTFSGEGSTHMALQKNLGGGAPSDPNALPAGTPPQIATMLGRPVAAERSGGSDLILRELASGGEYTLGSVADFSFDKKGRVLIFTIDSPGQTGSGLQIRTLATGVQNALDTAKATYSRIAWTEDGEALTCLKGVDDKDFEGKLYSILAIKDVAGKPEKVLFDPTKDTSFPKGMTISPNYTPHWSQEKDAIFFGIHELKKKGEGTSSGNIAAATGAPDRGRNDPDFTSPLSPLGRGVGGEGELQDPNQRRGPQTTTPPASTEKPEVVIWHWKDTRMQSMQQVQASNDRNLNYLCVYHPKDKKFTRLADEKLRIVSPPPKGKWALGRDVLPYQYMANLDGRQFQDVYAIDTTTGEKKKVLTQNRWLFGLSEDGSHFLYYDDGHFFTYEFASSMSFKITGDTPVSFIDTEDDHNIQKPPTRPMGWSKDGQWVLISDNWDVWKLPVHGGPGTNLTLDGKKDGIRYQNRYRFDPEEKGVDLNSPQYFAIVGEHTKKSGYARIEPGQPGAKRLAWDDVGYGGLIKPRFSDRVFFARETHIEPTNWYVSDLNLSSPAKLTDAFPEQNKFLWSSGVRLVDFTSKNGDKLQAALYLPANYEKGKSYPTIVYIYEHLSDSLNRYTAPTANGFNKAYYTSHGYAVLMPDINYKINDPGMSAVACVLPAVDAAVATGIVDKNRIGLTGHSWGGYQTAFLVTQTNAFKAAVAGAPLTNLISMYSSIYWNTGTANQPIFESSQGRFTTGYWDNLDAYARNSPVYHAKNVQTPLIILHNDKDGAVDFNQGVEYFNTLRRLQKPVVMLQYKGENHGLTKPANRKDYTVRMKEFFDHYLLEKPAPDWLKEGIPHLKLDEHLKARGGK